MLLNMLLNDREAGSIFINMHTYRITKILLEISDNGIGLPVNFDIATTTAQWACV